MGKRRLNNADRILLWFLTQTIGHAWETKSVAASLCTNGVTYASLTQELARLSRSGFLERVCKGLYRLRREDQARVASRILEKATDISKNLDATMAMEGGWVPAVCQLRIRLLPRGPMMRNRLSVPCQLVGIPTEKTSVT